ncbi:hypothetical protein [Chitinophaga sp. LS1]|uniref:hypothetical protein n=1 Tax=Chitinophaga sp. LS1 TaxID=3051176 RepID=UPI002AAB0517|nr:hypothetical protein [Chitinophaga sp. LS1]WPV64052.1 hypothetical protein QQL36_19820 [Chitinophaga sp. LS1]
MFSLFKKSKVNIQSVRIPNFGWEKIRDEEGIILWINPEETIAISVHFLSQVRHYINLIEKEVKWDTEIDKLETFER